jgi:hypothetical protein
VRVMSLRESVFRQLLGWAEQFSAPPQNLVPAEDDADDDFAWSVMARCTYRPGLLLNADELASLVHLPAQTVLADRLQRVASRTRPALETNEQTKGQDGSVVLGMNEHRGQTLPDYDPSAAIILNTRQNYATPRNMVEWQLRQASVSPQRSNTPAPSTSIPPPPKPSPPKSPRPTNKKEQPTEQGKRKKPPYRPADMWPPGHPNAPKPKPSEPSEDALVN